VIQPIASSALAQVGRFLVAESYLLDHDDWDAWLALFTADGVYWMPADPQQATPFDHVSLIYDDATMRELRCRRFRDRGESAALSLQPHPRSLRCLTNVDIIEHTAATVVVRANLVFVQYVRPSTQTFYARVRWELQIDGERCAIRRKRVDLLNCDGPLSDILVYV
jgi:benzoate/toluate 1,2-dioxygenase beta subunit